MQEEGDCHETQAQETERRRPRPDIHAVSPAKAAEQEALSAPRQNEERQLERSGWRFGCEARNACRVRVFNRPNFGPVKIWIINDQFGRRNVTAEQAIYLRGKRYIAEKTAGHGAKSGGQNAPQKTDERLVAECKVSPKTIKRDAKFAEADVSSRGVKARRGMLCSRDFMDEGAGDAEKVSVGFSSGASVDSWASLVGG